MNQGHLTMKLIASTVVFTFLTTSLGITPDTFAATGVSTPEVSAFSAATLQIPAELGQVTETVTGDPKAPSLIHIQSAHGNYPAEKNIEKLLGYIEQNTSVNLMLLEGASGKLHPEMFRIFPKHPDFNKKVTDKLMQEGYLTGPETFLIGSARKTEGWGIENLDAYKKDREAFISVVRSDKTAQTFLMKLRAAIDNRFAGKLNKDLLNFVRQEEAFGSGTLPFEGWLKALYDASKRHLKLDLSDAFYQAPYPFLIRYDRLQKIGAKIDRKKALKEADAFLKELTAQNVSSGIIANFKTLLQLTEKDLLKGSNLTPEGYSTLRRAFDNAFEKLPKDFSMKHWPNWTLYAQYIILMQEMSGQGLHEETVRLKDQIQAVLAKTEAEKDYLSSARKLSLLRKLFDLELTRPEYEELTQTVKTSDIHGIQALYKTALDFYATAVDRENKMFANALQHMNLQKKSRAVIVTGGFHAEGLKKLAASKNCSYLQITPRIPEISKRDHEVYLRSILGSRDIETSQMSALLGIVDRTQRATVTGIAAAKDWARDVRGLIRNMIQSEPVSSQSALARAFSNSIFSPKAALKPASAPVVARAEVRSDKDPDAIFNKLAKRDHRILQAVNFLVPYSLVIGGIALGTLGGFLGSFLGGSSDTVLGVVGGVLGSYVGTFFLWQKLPDAVEKSRIQKRLSRDPAFKAIIEKSLGIRLHEADLLIDDARKALKDHGDFDVVYHPEVTGERTIKAYEDPVSSLWAREHIEAYTIESAYYEIVPKHGVRSEVRPQQPGSRSEMRIDETPIVPQAPAPDMSSRTAKIGTAIRVAANTVSPLISSTPVYASEIAPQVFAGTSHYQKAQTVPAAVAAKWPALNHILSRFAAASTARMVIDQRQGIPDAASVLPLVSFARYNPKAAVALALIAGVPEVAAFEKELARLSQEGALPQNFKIQAFADEGEFVAEFNEFYNSSVPFGRPVALVTDRERSIVTAKIGSRRNLLSVVGGQNPLKQTASALLAADKLLDESIWSMGYHFVSIDKLGGLEALMAELTGFVAAQARMAASA